MRESDRSTAGFTLLELLLVIAIFGIILTLGFPALQQLIHRYKILSVHYVSPTDDNRYQTQKMRSHGVFSDVHDEIGQVIVAVVDADSIKELLAADRVELMKLITKTQNR